ncbi:MAG: LysM peptidoglycan-binding domain-containing protein [Actinomycetota bacterium]
MQNIRSESSTCDATSAQVRVRVRPGRVGLFMAIFALVTVLYVPRIQAMVEVPAAPKTHVVASGETLWHLARSYASSEDPRAYVRQVRETNRLGSPRILPGQTLILPAT